MWQRPWWSEYKMLPMWQRPWWSEYINLGGFQIDLMWPSSREYNMARSHRGCV